MKIRLALSLLVFSIFALPAFAQRPFITTWKSNNPGSAATQMIIPVNTGPTYNYSVYWEQVGNPAINGTLSGQTGSATINVPVAGTYRVEINGTFPQIYFDTALDRQKIVSIDQWGDIVWTNMMYAFRGCTNLTHNAADGPNLSAATDLTEMFSGATSFNGNLNNWNVSSVISMERMFKGATAFNGNIGNWNVSNVVDMSEMFANATSFNQDIGGWNTGSVTDTNSPNVCGGFGNPQYSCILYDYGMADMFNGAKAFNQDISSWNVTNMTSLDNMFKGASAFNQNLGAWNIIGITNTTGGSIPGNSSYGMTDVFSGSGLSIVNYEATLAGWAAKTVKPNIRLGAGGVVFCNGASRTLLTQNPNKWILSGEIQSCPSTQPFVTVWKTNNPGVSASNQIKLPMLAATNGNYYYDVHWEQVGAPGNQGDFKSLRSNATITFPSEGTYRLEIVGLAYGFAFVNSPFITNSEDFKKLISIEKWGNTKWTNLTEAFAGCTNLEYSATDVPDLSNITSLYGMFRAAESFNGNIANWDVSKVTNMGFMFSGAKAFNQNISSWDVSKVTDMASMFNAAIAFNQNISTWNVSKVTNMSSMFNGAAAFNQNIANWNTALVTNMSRMFSNSGFNQNIGSWNVSNVTTMEEMLSNSAFNIANFDAAVGGWASRPVKPNVKLGAANHAYCNTSAVIATLTGSPNNWVISGITKSCQSSEAFITTWKTNNAGTSGPNQIKLPAYTTGYYNYDVYWEEVGVPSNHGTITERRAGITITFPTPGIYRVEIRGSFPRLYFHDEGDKEKLISIEHWGDMEWTSMESAFSGCFRMVNNATDVPNLSALTNMDLAFSEGASFNPANVGDWDVSHVTTMRYMFSAASTFNGDISGWNVSNVTNMNAMFYSAGVFNQDISGWDVSRVTDMGIMFQQATLFNQDISKWNVSKVTNFYGMFANARAFSQNLATWDVSSATNMGYMFYEAWAFDQDLGMWNVTKVTSMDEMFKSEYLAREPHYIGGLSKANYEATLTGWALKTLKPNVKLGAPGRQYCNAAAARAVLITNFGWNITGDEQVCRPFTTLWKPDNPGTSGPNQITIPVSGAGYNYTVEWVQVSISTEGIGTTGGPKYDLSLFKTVVSIFETSVKGTLNAQTGSVTITFPSAGIYRIKITGKFPAINFNNTGDRQKIIAIEQWGDTEWTSMENAFNGCTNLDYRASDTPLLSKVTSMTGMFAGASDFNGDIGDWDVSRIVNMSGMFKDAKAFNQNIGAWDIRAVTNMTDMFANAGIATLNYDSILMGWSTKTVKSAVSLGSTGLRYCNGKAARQKLITDRNWSITGDTESCTKYQYITTWKTDNDGESESNQIIIRATRDLYDIYWEEVGKPTNNGTLASRKGGTVVTFPAAGTYRVSISGNFRAISVGPDAKKLLSIEQWGDTQWIYLLGAFGGCTNLTYNAIDIPNLTYVEELTGMFNEAALVNADLGNWDVSRVTHMDNMFKGARAFNGKITKWNVGNVTNMSGMFWGARAFNQDIGDWNVGKVVTMSDMFYQASAFNQDLGDWDIRSVGSMEDMLDLSGLSMANYDLTLIGWAAKTPKNAVKLGVDNLEYCNGADARNTLVQTYKWSISGDTKKCATNGEPTGLLEGDYPLEVFPNPTDHYVHVQFPSEIKNRIIKLSDVHGRILTSKEAGSQSEKIEVNSLPAGLYILYVIEGDRLVKAVKLIRN